MRQHRIPLHLEQEEKFFFGLTPRQLLILAIGSTLTYAVIPNDLSPASWAIGLTVATLLALSTLAIAFVRVKNRDLEQWLLIVLIYLAQPKCFLWHPLLEEEEGEQQHRRHTKREDENRDEWA